jgi:hypothetical protein
MRSKQGEVICVNCNGKDRNAKPIEAAKPPEASTVEQEKTKPIKEKLSPAKPDKAQKKQKAAADYIKPTKEEASIIEKVIETLTTRISDICSDKTNLTLAKMKEVKWLYNELKFYRREHKIAQKQPK